MSRRKKNANHGLEDNIQLQEIFFYTNLTIKVKEEQHKMLVINNAEQRLQCKLAMFSYG